MSCAEYVESIKNRLLTDALVIWHDILTERASESEGYFRARVYFEDGSLLDFSAYVIPAENDAIELVSYRYHWQDKNEKLISRWDNTPHFPHLPNAPHHIHSGETSEVTAGNPIHIFEVLDIIATQLK